MTDREQIQELMAHYAEAIDDKNYDGIATCFARDASAQYAAMPEPIVGNTVIANFMKDILSRLDATTHMFTNFIIEVNGDTARMRAKIIAQHVRKGVPGGDKLLAGGKYDAQIRRLDGKWKLARVRGTSLWHEGNEAIMLP
jgi:ketosteroid isomerase-like protein